MKKIISLLLVATLFVTMIFSATVSVSAETTISDVDVATIDRIGVDTDKEIYLSTEIADNGDIAVTFSNYKIQLFKSDGTVDTSILWMKGGIAALKDSNGNGVVLKSGTTYSINIIYDVTNVGTEDATYYPQIGLARNNHSSNIMTDNGTVVYTANKHGTTGSYSLSYQTTPSGNQPLRLAFGGHGAVTIKSIDIKAVQHIADVKNIDLINVSPIVVSSPSYSNFTPATDSTPLSLDVNATYAYNGTLFDGTNTWLNTWTKMDLKSMIPLKYDANNYVVLNKNKNYTVTVKYKVTATTATEVKDYPELGLVYNLGTNTTQDNGSKVIAAQRIAPTSVGVEQTLTNSFSGSSYAGYPLRLAFTGKGSFEVTSVVVQEYTNVVPVTFVNDGITTVDYVVINGALPTPVKDGYTFMGWFDADGVKYTTANSSVTLNAAWAKSGNVDLTASDMISGSKATMTLDIPTDADSALGVTIQGFQGLLMSKEDVVHTGTVYTGGAAVSLEYSNDNYVGLDKDSKYIVNVEYDVTNIGTYDKGFHPQIAILYNANTLTQDNGQIILDAKKHSETVDNASISCVVSGVTAKALRLAFDGQGAFNIKSVTVTEMPADTIGLNIVHLADSVYSTDKVVVAEKGAAIADLNRTLLHNFGGWYNGEEKVTTVSGDVELTAKWFDRTDVNMNGVTDAVDVVATKKALGASNSDLLFDIDRDNNVTITDTAVLRGNLLGDEIVTVEGNNISTYTVESGAQASFMTARATESLVETIDGYSNTSTKASSDKKIIVGISNIKDSVLKTAALENLTGINGDVYGLNDYKIFLKEGNIYIEAGSDYATAFAVNKFVDFLDKNKIIPTGFTLSGTYNNEKDVLDGYSYTWGDEFNAETLNTGKWWITAENASEPGPFYSKTNSYYIASQLDGTYGGPWIDPDGNPNMQEGVIERPNVEGEDYSLNDGLLVLNTRKTDNGYTAVRLNGTNQFKYGIMTARVRLATKNGACSTFWARSNDDNGASVNEFDFVENFGMDKIIPNLHTWNNYSEDTNHKVDIQDCSQELTPAEGESFSDSFHDIALYWTSEKIVFYFDGVPYLDLDISADPEKWEAFHKTTHMVMGISAPSGYYAMNYDAQSPGDYLGNLIDSFSENMYVDYVRVFQK